MGFLAPIALAATAIGTGVSVYSGLQAAKNQSALAAYNANAQLENARMQQQAEMMQAAMANKQAAYQEQMARINNALAQSEATARLNNAQSLTNQAEAQTTADRESIKNEQIKQAQFQGMARAAIAGSGVVESGSPLEQLAANAGNMQGALNEMQYSSDLSRRQTLGKAQLEEFGGKLAMAGADAQLQEGLASASMMRDQAGLFQAKGAAERRMGEMQSNLTLMQGEANAQGSRLGAWGSLFSGLGSLGNQWTSWNSARYGWGNARSPGMTDAII